MLVTFGLPYRLASPRIWRAVEPCPGRFTHHVPVAAPEQIDAALIAWGREAYGFSAAK